MSESRKQTSQASLQRKTVQQNQVVIVEDKQVSEFERLQHQNDLSSLYSSQKQAYNFDSIGGQNSDEYIESMLNSRNQTFNKNQLKFQQQNSSRLRSSTTYNQEDKNQENESEVKILQQIKNSEKKNIWQQISENILTPFAPKFQGLYDNSKFIPKDLLKMDKADENEQTPHSEEKEMNWESSEYDSDDNESQTQKNNHIPSLVTSPLLRKKTRTENFDTVLQKAQLQEPFLHTKLIKQITETNDSQLQKIKSEHSPLRYKSLNSKSFYSKVSFADQSKINVSAVASSQKNFMRKVRFEHLPNTIKDALTDQSNEQSSSQYQIISKEKSINKIHLDKILVILENQDKNSLQKIYVPKLKEQIDKNQKKTRVLSAAASLATREQKKKLLNLQILIDTQNTNKNTSDDFQKQLRRRSCCCEECGGINSKLERIKDLVLDKDIPIKQQRKSPPNKTSNLNSPVSSQSKQSSFDSRFQRKRHMTTKINIIQSSSQSYVEIPKTSGSSHNISLSKISSLNETQILKSQNDKKPTVKEPINENCQNSPTKKNSWKKNQTSQLQKVPSFKTLRLDREIKIQKQFEKSKERSQPEEKTEQNKQQIGLDKNADRDMQSLDNSIDETLQDKQTNNGKQINQIESSEKMIDKILKEYDTEQKRESQEQILQICQLGRKSKQNALPKIEQKLGQKRCQTVQNGVRLKRSESVINYNKEGDAFSHKNVNGMKKDRSLSNLLNLQQKEQQNLSSRESRQRNDKSLPNILSKKSLVNQSPNNGIKSKQKDIMDQNEVIQENSNKKIKKIYKKGAITTTIFDKFQVYQNPNEFVFKTKQQIIAESYQQICDQQKKQLVFTKQRSPALIDLNIEKRQQTPPKANTYSENFNLQINDIKEQNQIISKKSRSSKRLKKPNLKENMEKLKTVYDL